MTLESELGLKRPIKISAHRALLNIYYTASCLKKYADDFFRPLGLTDVQFNVLMLLGYQSGTEGGLSQAQISDILTAGHIPKYETLNKLAEFFQVNHLTLYILAYAETVPEEHQNGMLRFGKMLQLVPLEESNAFAQSLYAEAEAIVVAQESFDKVPVS